MVSRSGATAETGHDAPASEEAPTPVAGRTRAWVVLVMICVFGPYLVGGIRTEQAALYVSGAVAAAVLLARREIFPALRPGRVVVGLWAAYAAVVAGGAFLAVARWPWGSGSVVSGLDNALLPLATMTAASLWVRRSPVAPLVRAVCWVLAVGMALNGAVALLTAFVGVDHVPLVSRFWAASGSGTSVALLAAGSGRFSGIFNQPAEAGIAYTLAACGVVFLARTEPRVVRRWLLVLWPFVLLGGLLTLSKIFVVGGVLVLVVLILSARPARWVLAGTAVATTVVVVAMGAVGWLGAWGASGSIEWYVNSVRSGDSLSYTVSAGRFGEPGRAPVVAAPPETPAVSGGDVSEAEVGRALQQPGGLVELGKAVLERSPWFGFGAAGALVSYDSTWIESLIVGGAVGVLLVLAVHVALTVRWLRLRGRLRREEWRLAGAVLVVAWGSSFGMPSLTGNRESSLMWLLLTLLLVFRPAVPAAHPSDRVEPRDV